MAEAEAVIILEMEKLESLVVKKENLEQYEKSIVEELINEMKVFVGFVRDKKVEEGRRLNYLISEVVDMAHIAQQAINEYGEDHGYADSIKYAIKFDLSELKKINNRLRDLGARSQSSGVGEGDGDVVELKEEVELFLHNMENVDPFPVKFLVACIAGVSGSGKSTLARQVYNYGGIVDKYEHRAWVNCMESLSQKELLINIIRQVAADGYPEAAEETGDAQVHDHQMMLIQQLQGKQFFIVLDNLWRDFSLLSVFVDLKNNDTGTESRILLTSHYLGGMAADYYHPMKPLDLDKSWQLLQKTIFYCAPKIPKKLERQAKVMLMKHSGGLPLAIKEVGTEWVEKRLLGSEWEEVIESRYLQLKASLASIESFYDTLFPGGQSYFHHLGFFKEGATMRARKSEQIFFAAGLLAKQHSDFLHKQWLLHFIEQNIIEVKDEDKHSNTKNLYVLGIYHKLSIMKAKELNNGTFYHVIYCSRESSNFSTAQDEQLICLSFNGGGCFDASPSFWKCFEQLKVLDLEGFGLKFLPETIGELIELRYLGLRNNYIQELPHSLCCLKKLEVLDIALNFMVEVPDIIWEMHELCHLYMSDIFCRKPLKIEALKNLKTLTYISVDNWAYEVSGLRLMTSLQKLGIEELDGNSDVRNLLASLAELKNLDCLLLRGFRFRSLPPLDELGALHGLTELKLEGIITSVSFPPNLVFLTLVNSCLNEDPMPVLENLSRLSYLKLKNAYTGRQMIISEGGFPRINHLYIEELRHLRYMQVGQGTLQRLTKLEISSCPCLNIYYQQRDDY